MPPSTEAIQQRRPICELRGVAAGLGLVLGREALSCTTPAYAPRFAASGLKPPKSINADQVSVQVQAFPAYSTPPKPSPC